MLIILEQSQFAVQELQLRNSAIQTLRASSFNYPEIREILTRNSILDSLGDEDAAVFRQLVRAGFAHADNT